MPEEAELLTLGAVAEQFGEWRRIRTKAHTPLSLKRQAVGLLESCSQSQVLKGLGISHEMLKRWQREVGGTASNEVFVELPAAVVESTTAVVESARLKVTRQRTNGERLSIEGELNERQWRWAFALLSESGR